MDYKTQYQMYLSQASAALEDACAKFLPEESEVCRAARYSLLGGGKRIRAVLVLSVCDMLGGDPQTAGAFSAAVEMLHCYSLIHDDLPCMDNDDLRRGRPSCHKAFGEATAMLAGDVLLTEAFEAIANAPACPQACVQAAKALGLGAGSRGMVYGQELDLKYEALAAILVVLGLMTVLVFVGGIMLFVLGTASLFEHFAMGLMFIGLGIAAEGSCLLLICGCILFYGVFLPWAVKGIIQLCRQAAGYLSARA